MFCRRIQRPLCPRGNGAHHGCEDSESELAEDVRLEVDYYLPLSTSLLIVASCMFEVPS